MYQDKSLAVIQYSYFPHPYDAVFDISPLGYFWTVALTIHTSYEKNV